MSASMTAAEVRWRDMALGTRLWPSTSEVQEIYIGLSNIGGPSKTASEQRVPGVARHLVCAALLRATSYAWKTSIGPQAQRKALRVSLA